MKGTSIPATTEDLEEAELQASMRASAAFDDARAAILVAITAAAKDGDPDKLTAFANAYRLLCPAKQDEHE
jgi:hypothetical protein